MASILICGPNHLQDTKLALDILKKCAHTNEALFTTTTDDIQQNHPTMGNADAQNMLGELSEMGLQNIEDEPNYEIATKYYRMAIQQGHHRAMFNLGSLYERGLYVEKSMERALKFYNQVLILIVCKAGKHGCFKEITRFETNRCRLLIKLHQIALY